MGGPREVCQAEDAAELAAGSTGRPELQEGEGGVDRERGKEDVLIGGEPRQFTKATKVDLEQEQKI